MAKWGEGDPRWIVEERPDATNVNNWHWTEKNADNWSKKKIKVCIRSGCMVGIKQNVIFVLFSFGRREYFQDLYHLSFIFILGSSSFLSHSNFLGLPYWDCLHFGDCLPSFGSRLHFCGHLVLTFTF